jgi:hypothetical protein
VNLVKLFHVSENSGIATFEPRLSEHFDQPVIWAVSDERLHNYLVPRDCPRVTYYAGQQSSSEDVKKFLGPSLAVVAVEIGWLPRLESCRLYGYELPYGTFRCTDDNAGYFVSHQSVQPTCVHLFDDPISELQRRRVDLRAVPELWTLRDAVMASSLSYSIIRMRNAQPLGFVE